MSSRVLMLLGLLVACVLLISSEVSARELAETTSKDEDATSTATTETSDVNDAKYGGDRGPGGRYGGGPGGGYGRGLGSGCGGGPGAGTEGTQAVVAMAAAVEVMEGPAPSIAVAAEKDTMVQVAGAALMLVRLLIPSQK